MSSFGLLRYVSLRNIARAPVRSGLTFFAVMLGVAMIVAMNSANQAVLASFNELSERASSRADAEISSDEAGVDQSLVEELAKHKQLVAHVAPRLEQYTFLASDKEEGDRVLVMGLDFLGDTHFFPYRVSEGTDVVADPLAFLNNPKAILMTAELAKRRGLQVGSKVQMRTAETMREFEVAGLLEETSSSKLFGGQVVVMFYDAVQIAFSRDGRADRLSVAFAEGVERNAGIERLRELVGARGQVGPPSSRASQFARITSSFQAAVQVQGLIALFVAMFLVYNAVGVAVSQRKREIGILRSLGLHRNEATFIFMAEAVVIGIFGSLVGVWVGYGLAHVVVMLLTPSVSRLYGSIAPAVPSLTLDIALLAVGAGIVATLAASWLPASRASRTEPVEAMRRNAHAGSRGTLPPKPLMLLGVTVFVVGYLLTRTGSLAVAFVGVGLLMLAGALCTPWAVDWLGRGLRYAAPFWVGRPAMMGVDNARRDLGRSGLTAASLVITTSLSLVLGVYTYSFEKSCTDWVNHYIPADGVLTVGSPLVDQNALPFSPVLEAKVAAFPGVEATTGLRSLSVTVNELRIEILAIGTRLYLSQIDDGAFRRVIDGPEKLPVDSLEKEPAVLVSENYSLRTGIRAGDFVELPSPTGPHKFRVVAVVVDYSSDQGWMMMDLKYLAEYWKDPRIEAIDIFVKPGADVPTVLSSIRRGLNGTESGVFVLEGGEVKEEVLNVLRQTMAVSQGSELIALIVAILGVVGTMAAAVIDRVREIGILRAIGGGRGHVVWSVVSEAGWLSLCAIVLAALVSLPLSAVFLDVVGPRATGWSIPLSVSALSAARAIGLVLLSSMIAGVLPGWQASRLRVTEALSAE